MGTIRFKALIPTSLERVWDFIIDARNQPLWVANIESVGGADRPMEAGDHLTQWRRDFFRLQRQDLLVEEVVPYRSFQLRVLTGKSGGMQGSATLSVEAAADGATWIEEALTYSMGDGPIVRWIERWLLDPLFRVMVRWHSGRAFRRLAERLAARG